REDRAAHARFVDRFDAIADDIGDLGAVRGPRGLALFSRRRVGPELHRAGRDIHRPDVVAAECGVNQRGTELTRWAVRCESDTRAVARPDGFAVVVAARRRLLNVAAVGIDEHNVEESAVRLVVTLECNALAIGRDLRPG